MFSGVCFLEVSMVSLCRYSWFEHKLGSRKEDGGGFACWSIKPGYWCQCLLLQFPPRPFFPFSFSWFYISTAEESFLFWLTKQMKLLCHSLRPNRPRPLPSCFSSALLINREYRCLSVSPLPLSLLPPCPTSHYRDEFMTKILSAFVCIRVSREYFTPSRAPCQSAQLLFVP